MQRFDIKTHKGSHTGALPAHFDIHVHGESDSLATIWGTQEQAEFIAKALARRDVIESLLAHLDRPGLIGG